MTDIEFVAAFLRGTIEGLMLCAALMVLGFVLRVGAATVQWIACLGACQWESTPHEHGVRCSTCEDWIECGFFGGHGKGPFFCRKCR